MNLSQSKSKYNEYLINHIANVKKAYRLLNQFGIFNNILSDEAIIKAKELCDKHDESKWGDPEYDTYRQYFDPTDEEVAGTSADDVKKNESLREDWRSYDSIWITPSGKLIYSSSTHDEMVDEFDFDYENSVRVNTAYGSVGLPKKVTKSQLTSLEEVINFILDNPSDFSDIVQIIYPNDRVYEYEYNDAKVNKIIGDIRKSGFIEHLESAPRGDRSVFNVGWLHHLHNNPHHWEYWNMLSEDNIGSVVSMEMPDEYIAEMICDWLSFSIKARDLSEVQKWYDKKKDKLVLHDSVRSKVESILEKIKSIDQSKVIEIYESIVDSLGNSQLNPKLWNDDGSLKSEVSDKILEIVAEFIEELQVNEIPTSILDVWLVGSNASYNYTDASDLDVHLIVRLDDASCDTKVLQILYNYFKSSFNKRYDIKIKGIDVELYIEDINSTVVSNGIYSMQKAEWIKHPVPIDVPSVDISHPLQTVVTEYEKVMTGMSEMSASDLIDHVYMLRKVGLATEGEYSVGNLVFKKFRNLGYLDNLRDKMAQDISDELSLEGMMNLKEFSEEKMVPNRDIDRALEVAKTVDPSAQAEYESDIIYGEDDKGNIIWGILLDGDMRAYDVWGDDMTLAKKVEKAVNDASDEFWNSVKGESKMAQDISDELSLEGMMKQRKFMTEEVDGRLSRDDFDKIFSDDNKPKGVSLDQWHATRDSSLELGMVRFADQVFEIVDGPCEPKYKEYAIVTGYKSDGSLDIKDTVSTLDDARQWELDHESDGNRYYIWARPSEGDEWEFVEDILDSDILTDDFYEDGSRTVGEFLRQGVIKSLESRISRLKEIGAPKVIISNLENELSSYKNDEQSIEFSGDTDLLNEPYETIEWKKGRMGKPYAVINGTINYFPMTRYGNRFITKSRKSESIDSGSDGLYRLEVEFDQDMENQVEVFKSLATKNGLECRLYKKYYPSRRSSSIYQTSYEVIGTRQELENLKKEFSNKIGNSWILDSEFYTPEPYKKDRFFDDVAKEWGVTVDDIYNYMSKYELAVDDFKKLYKNNEISKNNIVNDTLMNENTVKKSKGESYDESDYVEIGSAVFDGGYAYEITDIIDYKDVDGYELSLVKVVSTSDPVEDLFMILLDGDLEWGPLDTLREAQEWFDSIDEGYYSDESDDEFDEAVVDVEGDEIVIRGKKGDERFRPINGDPVATKHSFDGIMKHSVGRAWQWLKKQRPIEMESSQLNQYIIIYTNGIFPSVDYIEASSKEEAKKKCLDRHKGAQILHISTESNESVEFSEATLDEIDEIEKLAREIGIYKLKDLDRFRKEYPEGTLLQALRDYRKELGDDFKIESKSLKEGRITWVQGGEGFKYRNFYVDKVEGGWKIGSPDWYSMLVAFGWEEYSNDGSKFDEIYSEEELVSIIDKFYDWLKSNKDRLRKKVNDVYKDYPKLSESGESDRVSYSELVDKAKQIMSDSAD